MKKKITLAALALSSLTPMLPATAAEVTPPAEMTEHGAKLGQGVPNEKGLAAATPTNGILGMDVSSHQPVINWQNEWNKGARFSYNKVSEGTVYVNPLRQSQAQGARSVGMYQGGYHFALPSMTSGAAQANYFVDNGGGWTNDGKTLPGMLDVEWNPYPSLGNMCFNMSQSQMRTWISDFVTTYKNRTGVNPEIYTAKSWWDTCVGNTTMFSHIPLHVARYASTVGELPLGWQRHAIWQYSDSDIFAGDSNVFNGNAAQLRNFAAGGDPSKEYATRFSLIGAIGGYYQGRSAVLGAPLGNEVAAAGGGAVQRFANGYSVYWHNNVGTASVFERGGIGGRFNSQGGTNGAWGYPANDERAYGAGATQTYRNPLSGTQTNVYWSPWTGTYTTNGRGAIQATWQGAGGISTLGFPSTDEQAYNGGARQYFKTQSGSSSVLYWSAANGTHRLNANGGLHWHWLNTGGSQKWGFPITSEQFAGNGAYSFYTQKGTSRTAFYWTAQAGTVTLNAKGAIYNTWKSLGGTGFGAPVTSEELNSSTGVVSVKFSNGKSINWTASRGTWVS